MNMETELAASRAAVLRSAPLRAAPRSPDPHVVLQVAHQPPDAAAHPAVPQHQVALAVSRHLQLRRRPGGGRVAGLQRWYRDG